MKYKGKKCVYEFRALTISNHKASSFSKFAYSMIPIDMSFEFKRLQHLKRFAFAMTINKAQEQSLKVFGIDLENP